MLDPLEQVRRWVEDVVVEWNLCPFARRELLNDRVRFVLSEATSEEELLLELAEEVDHLDRSPEVETTLLVHPEVLTDFEQYNQFLNYAEALLQQLGREGVYQIASFHPHYRFEGTEPEAAENYTNRSPFPLLHLLREDSLEEAIERYPDPEKIPERNIRLLNKMERTELEKIFRVLGSGSG